MVFFNFLIGFGIQKLYRASESTKSSRHGHWPKGGFGDMRVNNTCDCALQADESTWIPSPRNLTRQNKNQSREEAIRTPVQTNPHPCGTSNMCFQEIQVYYQCQFLLLFSTVWGKGQGAGKGGDFEYISVLHEPLGDYKNSALDIASSIQGGLRVQFGAIHLVIRFPFNHLKSCQMHRPSHDPMSRSYVTILCHDPMSRSYVTILCHDPMSRSYVTILCHAPEWPSDMRTHLCDDLTGPCCLIIVPLEHAADHFR
ncbi:hypothetical protein AAMO2058_000042600 [Amorphochlora amoebiformis]